MPLEFTVYILLGLPAIIAIVIGANAIYSDYHFFSKAIKTKGFVSGSIGSKHKKTNLNIGGQYEIANGLPRQASSKNDEYLPGGKLLLVEFKDEEGNTYQVRSKQTFMKIPNQVTVHYLPEDLSKFAVDGHYSGKMKYYYLVAGIILGLIPIILF